MPQPLRLVFAGTPDFAATILSALVASKHDVVACYTQPDRPGGRGRRLRASPVKQLADSHRITVFQPASLKNAEAVDTLLQLGADAMVVAAYGLLLPPPVIHGFELGCINVHASLLPRWRGAAPIQRAILAGDTRTGVAIMQMDEGLDTGAVYRTKETEISPEDTAASVHDRLATLGADTLIETLAEIAAGAAVATPQPTAGATYARRLSKSEARIDWRRPAVEIARAVRAFNPWPVAHTILDNGASLRIWRANPQPGGTGAPGTVLTANHDGLAVATGDGSLRITELQPAGRRRMAVADFLNAHAIVPGARLGVPR